MTEYKDALDVLNAYLSHDVHDIEESQRVAQSLPACRRALRIAHALMQEPSLRMSEIGDKVTSKAFSKGHEVSCDIVYTLMRDQMLKDVDDETK